MKKFLYSTVFTSLGGWAWRNRHRFLGSNDGRGDRPDVGAAARQPTEPVSTSAPNTPRPTTD